MNMDKNGFVKPHCFELSKDRCPTVGKAMIVETYSGQEALRIRVVHQVLRKKRRKCRKEHGWGSKLCYLSIVEDDVIITKEIQRMSHERRRRMSQPVYAVATLGQKPNLSGYGPLILWSRKVVPEQRLAVVDFDSLPWDYEYVPR